MRAGLGRRCLHVAPRSQELLERDSNGENRDYLLMTGRWKPDFMLEFAQDSGSLACDFVSTTLGFLNLISPKVMQLLDNIGATGWDAAPASIRMKSGEIIGGYGVLMITGKCGPIRRDLARPEQRRQPGGHFDTNWIGLYFDLDKWDGSDIFCPLGTAHQIARERVILACKRAGITNLDTTPADEYIFRTRP